MDIIELNTQLPFNVSLLLSKFIPSTDQTGIDSNYILAVPWPDNGFDIWENQHYISKQLTHSLMEVIILITINMIGSYETALIRVSQLSAANERFLAAQWWFMVLSAFFTEDDHLLSTIWIVRSQNLTRFKNLSTVLSSQKLKIALDPKDCREKSLTQIFPPI